VTVHLCKGQTLSVEGSADERCRCTQELPKGVDLMTESSARPLRSTTAVGVEKNRRHRDQSSHRRRRLLQELLEDRLMLFSAPVHEAITSTSLEMIDESVVQQIRAANSTRTQ